MGSMQGFAKEAKVVQAIYTFMDFVDPSWESLLVTRLQQMLKQWLTNLHTMKSRGAAESIFAVFYQLIIGSIWIYYLASIVP